MTKNDSKVVKIALVKVLRNWARAIRKVRKANFYYNQFQSKRLAIKKWYSKLEVMNQSYLVIDHIV